MKRKDIDACLPVDLSDEDIYEAMSDIPGYLDITPGDFKELYLKAYQHALMRLARSVTAEEVMTKEVVSVRRETPLRDVAEKMARKGVSGVPVLEADGTVAGVISETDFLSTMGPEKALTLMEVVADCLRGGRCLAAPMRAQSAESIMSSPAVSASAEAPLPEVANIMSKRNINRVPIIDRDGRLIGIVSRADVVRSSPGDSE